LRLVRFIGKEELLVVETLVVFKFLHF